MHPTLRKRHRLIWLILAIALPLLFVAALMVIPKKVNQEKLYQAPAKAMGFKAITEKTNNRL